MAGDEVLGSLSKLEVMEVSINRALRTKGPGKAWVTPPLDTRQNGSHVICWAPSVLQDIEAELAGAVDIGVKHLADKFDAGRLVGVLFLEVHHQAEGSIFERRVGRADNDGIPIIPSVD